MRAQQSIMFYIISINLFLIPRHGCGHVGNQQDYEAVGMVLARCVQAVDSSLSMDCARIVNDISMAECWLSICPWPYYSQKLLHIP